MISFKFLPPSILVLFNFLLQSKGLDHGSSNPGGHQPFGIVLTSAQGIDQIMVKGGSLTRKIVLK